MSQTKFEEDLQVYFPDIYKLHQTSKWDKLTWEVVSTMMEFVDRNKYGEIKIVYQKGRINNIYATTEVSGGNDKKPNLNHPAMIEPSKQPTG